VYVLAILLILYPNGQIADSFTKAVEDMDACKAFLTEAPTKVNAPPGWTTRAICINLTPLPADESNHFLPAPSLKL
jgi:hypothetical protein